MQKILRLIQENPFIDSFQALQSTLAKMNHLIEHEYFLFGLSLQTTLTSNDTLIADNYPLA